MARKGTRVERDSMGEMQVRSGAFYGASTQRAVINFPISDLRLQRSFIRALALVKYGAAEVNCQHGKLDRKSADAIKNAALEVAKGRWDKQFVVDVFQTGSGTSTNMNANEVIANRAIQLLGGKLGDRSLIHPNDHVNLGMSSNDAIPTATHIAALLDTREKLLPSLKGLQKALADKAASFASVLKTGRTHLQDATPMTLGQEFSGYAAQVEHAIQAVEASTLRLQSVALGGTAVGTGVNTRADFAGSVLALVQANTALELKESTNHFQAQGSLDALVVASNALRAVAIALRKIADDIRWLGSGPRAGLGELALPEVQPGSSIMPGKVNPVIAESLCQVTAQVLGNDTVISIAAQSGTFELNVMQPVAAYNLLQSIGLLAAAADNFRQRCIEGLEATDRGPASVEQGLALCTALVPAIGYDAAAAISHEAAHSKRSIKQVALELSGLDEQTLNALLDPLTMTRPDPAPLSPTIGDSIMAASCTNGTKRKSQKKKQLVLGGTGGIACGKTAVGKMLEKLGAVVIDADHLGHELFASPNPTYRAVVRKFGTFLVDTEGGPINRKKLGPIVFNDPAARAALDEIMSPAIKKLMMRRIKENSAAKVVVVFVPLLFEFGFEVYFDEVWAITVDPATQLQRLMDRNKLSEEDARKRIAAQMTQDEKAKRSNRVIDNSGTLAKTEARVVAAFAEALSAHGL